MSFKAVQSRTPKKVSTVAGLAQSQTNPAHGTKHQNGSSPVPCHRTVWNADDDTHEEEVDVGLRRGHARTD